MTAITLRTVILRRKLLFFDKATSNCDLREQRAKAVLRFNSANRNNRKYKASFAPGLTMVFLMSTRSFWWLAEFKLTSKGIIVRKNGTLLTSEIITPIEIVKWLGYYILVRTVAGLRRMAYPSSPQIWFAPDTPRPWYVIWAAVSWAGFRFARSETDADIHFYFDDSTWSAPLSSTFEYVNGRCTDISKSRVAEAFDEAVGYRLSVDPNVYDKLAVEKGQINGAHDGRIVRCPAVAKTGKSYEKLVNATENGMAVDLRTSIVGGKPVAVIRKTKPISKRFSIHNSTVKYLEVSEVFTAAETTLIEGFCAVMKLQWGALDVLRDRDDGRIYIVDVNKTDTGPAVDLTWRDRIKLTQALADAVAAYVSPGSTSTSASSPSITTSMAAASVSRPVSTAKE
ncbi:MAG: hypothetical protein ABWZ40_01445 [Caulobacterales bacterium]